MADLFDPSSWVDGVTVAHALDYQHIASDIHTAGADRNLGSHNITNCAAVLGPGGASLYFSGVDAGFGTSSPNAIIHATNGVAAAIICRLAHTGSSSNPGNVLIISNGYAAAAGAWEVFGVYGNNFITSYLTVRDNGFVGIGTGAAIPTSPLQVVGLQTYASDAAAGAAGLTAGALFKDSSGGVHVKL